VLISILSASLVGFGLAYFKYQPQIENMETRLSQLDSTASGLQSKINALETNNSMLQSESELLNSTVTGLLFNISTLETSYGMLQSKNTILNATVNALSNYLGNISLTTDSSYYIFKQNGTYYAKSGLTGQIESQNESCSEVINYTLTHVPNGGAVLFEPLASSDDAYYIDSTIDPPNGTTLASESRTVTIRLANNTAVPAVIGLYNRSNVQVRNIRIDGNVMGNSTCCGIIIDSNALTNSSYGSNHLIENIVIDNCNETGVWIKSSTLNNVVTNVQVFHSQKYNLQVDSADNKLITVESGWAGLSGFEVTGMDNYFLNCISYGSGLWWSGKGDLSQRADGNGFCIFGPRNMLVGCDAGANYLGGFVLDNAVQTMLDSCVARDNGQGRDIDSGLVFRIPGKWGFDLYNSSSTILSGCLSTDESDNKTQDWGFTEGAGCDYNIVIGCNFEGNNIGAIAALVGVHSVITDTIGYETKNSGYTNFRYEAENVTIGTNNAFGAPQNFTSKTGAIVDFHVTMQLNINSSVTQGKM
jgi:hypothetical protein